LACQAEKEAGLYKPAWGIRTPIRQPVTARLIKEMIVLGAVKNLIIL
jgi:hypothetical protein